MRKILLFIICLLGFSNIFGQAYSTKIGTNALGNENGGGSNTAFGHYTLYSTVSAWTNNAQGAWAMFFNDIGQVNSAFGSSALFYNTSGYENTVLGFRSLFNNANGYRNTAVGFEAMFNSGVYNSLDGSLNTAIGVRALYSNYSGNYNVAVGDQAGFSIAEGSYNTFVGAYADANASGYTNATAIGSYATVTESNMVVLGNSSVSVIGGRVNWSILSDKRTKRDIEKAVPGLSFISKLQPVSYNYDIESYQKIVRPKLYKNFVPDKEREKIIFEDSKRSKESKTYLGLLAQDVENEAKKIGYNFSGVDKPQNDSSTYGIKYAELVVPLVKSIQELSTLNDSLKSELETLIQQINEFTDENNVPASSNAQLQKSYLYQNIPVRFIDSTTIRYRLKQDCENAIIQVIDINNQIMGRIQLNPKLNIGQIQIKGNQFPKGNYSYALIVDGKLVSRKNFKIVK